MCAPRRVGTINLLNRGMFQAVEMEAALQASSSGTQNLWPFLLYTVSVVAILAVALLLAWLLGSHTRQERATGTPYESGIVPVGSAQQTRMSIEFYLIAMFFVIFDLETIFIFGWAVALSELGWRGYAGATVFIVILLVALVYEWRSGVLDWGVKKRSGRGRYAVVGEDPAGDCLEPVDLGLISD